MVKVTEEDVKNNTPKKGYNICGVDAFEAPGEQLFIKRHVNSLEEARKIARKGDIILSPEGRI